MGAEADLPVDWRRAEAMKPRWLVLLSTMAVALSGCALPAPVYVRTITQSPLLAMISTREDLVMRQRFAPWHVSLWALVAAALTAIPLAAIASPLDLIASGVISLPADSGIWPSSKTGVTLSLDVTAHGHSAHYSEADIGFIEWTGGATSDAVPLALHLSLFQVPSLDGEVLLSVASFCCPDTPSLWVANCDPLGPPEPFCMVEGPLASGAAVFTARSEGAPPFVYDIRVGPVSVPAPAPLLLVVLSIGGWIGLQALVASRRPKLLRA